jgi:signal transduction histidine kinase/DNA-binding response OmpR family regulator
MIQDQQGYIWLLCDYKLTRFDGKKFKVFDDAQYGLNKAGYSSLAEDRFGKIWLLSYNEQHAEITVFDPLTEKSQSLSSYLNQEITLPSAKNCDYRLFRHEGTIWTVFSGGQSWVFDTTWRKVLDDTVQQIQRQRVVYMPISKDRFWKYNADAPSLQIIDSTAKVLQELHSRHQFTGLDENMAPWGIGLDHTSGKSIAITRLTDSVTISGANYATHKWSSTTQYINLNIIINSDGYGFFPSEDGLKNGIFYRQDIILDDLKDFLAKEFGLYQHSHNIFQLRDGSFWLTTTNGLVRLEIHENKFQNYLTEGYPLPHSSRGIYALSPDRFYVNTMQGTYFLKKGSAPQALNFPSTLHENYGYGLSFHDNKLWIPQIRQLLYTYDLETGEIRPYPLAPSVKNSTGYYWGSALFQGPNDQLLLCNDWGLLRIDESKAQLVPYQPGEPVYCWHQRGDQFWLGTKTGLYVLDQDGKCDQRLSFAKKKTPLNVYHIYEDEDDFFWLATDQGLIKWNTLDETYEQFTVEDGLPNDHLHAVYPDGEGYLWLPSNYGLIRFNKESHEIRSYFTEDGLPHDEFNRHSHYQDKQGNLYFGGLNGVAVFDPQHINHQFNETLRRISLQQLTLYERVSNQANDLTIIAQDQGPIDVPANTNRLQIKFITPYYGRYEVQYVWRLVGPNKTWNYLEEPILEIGGLSYGENQIELGAFLIGNKIGTMTTRVVTLSVLKPFYLQFWFLVTGALFLILAVGMLIRISNNRLKRRNRKLEERVVERTQQLAWQNETITKQAADLRHLDEAKSRFFINLSHELRTPLSLILGPVSDLIAHQELNTPTQQKQLVRIERNTQKIKRLIEEIMTLTRLDANQLKIQHNSIGYFLFIRRIFNTFQARANEKNIDYKFQYKGDKEIRLLVDTEKVERIVYNLLGNALKFTPVNGTIHLFCEVADDLYIMVTNSGTFIPEDERELIFERYYQRKTDKLDHRTGFGIGLALSKEYALLLSGTLTVRSSMAQGTSFELRLPKQVATGLEISLLREEKVQQRAELSLLLHETPADSPSSSRLLVVEDDPDMLDYLQDILGTAYQLTTAKDGQQALELLSQNPGGIDLIISDAMMPNVNGFELLAAVRKNFKEEMIPFILLTALSETASRLQALRIGVDAYLTKPFVKEELLARIDNLLHNQTSRKLFLSKSTSKGEELEKMILPSYDEIWMRKLNEVIEQNFSKPELKVNDIAAMLHISERTLRTQVKANTGLSPAQLLQKIRLEQALLYLQQRHYRTVSEVCYAVGIRNSSHFSRLFKQSFGKSPSDYFDES